MLGNTIWADLVALNEQYVARRQAADHWPEKPDHHCPGCGEAMYDLTPECATCEAKEALAGDLDAASKAPQEVL